MRILLLLALVGCEHPEAEARHAVADVPAPPPKAILGPGGWCPRPVPPPRRSVAHSFEVTQDLTSVKPMRKAGFDGYETSYDRDARLFGMYVGLDPSIENGKLRLSTFPTSCHETNAGCFAGYWSRPAALVLEDPLPVPACISYAIGLSGAIAIGVGHELRTYIDHDDGSVTIGPRIAAPALEALDVSATNALLQDPDGALWTATRDPSGAPVLTPAGKLPGHVQSAARGNNGLIFAYTDAALYALDEHTFAPRWHVDGEVWSVHSLDVPLTHYVLTVDRTAKPKVILHMLDAAGTEQKRITVYEGDVAEAHLERSYEHVKPDLYEGILIVHIAS